MKWCPGGLGVLLLCLAVEGCHVNAGYRVEDQKAAEKAIAEFHARVNSGDFEKIYAEADDAMKRAGSKDQLIAAMGETRNKLGAFQSVMDSKINVIIGAPVQVRAAYNSHFQKGDATELFTFVKRDNSLRLAFYNVSPGTAHFSP